LLPILPLLMLYVAPPLAWAFDAGPPRPAYLRWPAGLAMALLAALSLGVNLLGIAVDFNEHFLRLGRNDDFVFNWATFPPLAHWRILREGLVDLLWLQPTGSGLAVQWWVLLPPLVILALALAGLAVALTAPLPAAGGGKGARDALWPAFIAAGVSLPLVMVMMQAAATLPRQSEQARLDAPLLELLAAEARPDDGLLVAMPPFGDVQEITTRLMGDLRPAIPIWGWIESPPRAIEPAERQWVQQAVSGSDRRRLWLFERWHTYNAPDTPTAAWLNQTAFPLKSVWLERSGRLTLYHLPPPAAPAPLPLAVAFQGGISLDGFSHFAPTAADPLLAVRLNWQAAPAETLRTNGFPAGAVIVSVQLLDESGQQSVAQQDRLLVDLQQVERSPLLPEQSLSQGYGLQLPPDLPAGDYPLIVSLYVAESGRRLRQTTPPHDDFVYLTTITLP
jgi:hypothetical protein